MNILRKNIPTVKFDHAQGAYIAAKHVLEQGYRNLIFAVVTKPKWLANSEKWAFTCHNGEEPSSRSD